MRDDLVQLVQLQKLDEEIYQKTCQKNDLPIIIERLKAEEEEFKKKLTACKEQAQNVEKQRKAKELEVQTNEQQIQKNDGQLSQIKKNEEYKAMLHQIEELKKKNEALEEEIIVLMEKADEVQKKVAIEQSALNQEQAVLKEKEQEVQQKISLLDNQIEELKSKRSSGIGKVSNKVLAVYTQVLAKRKDTAMAMVKDGYCGACNMTLNPEEIDQARGGHVLIQCGTCSRILYHPETLGELLSKHLDD